MIRGDTRAYKFKRHLLDGTIITEEPESLYFTIKRSFNSKDFVVQKKLSDMSYMEEDEYWHFIIEPEDTENLSYGTYVFDLQAVQDGFKTTIAKGQFIIETEVTFKINEG